MSASLAFLVSGSGFWLAAIISTDLPSAIMFGLLGIVMFCAAVVFAVPE